MSTMWRSYAPGMPAVLTAEVTLDLGASLIFNKIVLTEYKQKADQLIVKVSDDQDNWSEVYNQTLSTSIETNRVTTIEFDHLSARYIKIVAPDAVYAFGIYELEVYQTFAGYESMIVRTDLYGGTEATISQSKENFHLYLLIGQSNMASRAPIETMDIPAINRVYLFNGLQQWEESGAGLVTNYPDASTLQGLNRYSSVEVKTKVNGFSLGSYFAKSLTEEYPHIAIGIISNARGGTTIDQWQKGSGTMLYEEAIRRTLEAMETGTLKGILWHQGESDVGRISTYMNSLNTIATNLRSDLGVWDVPFIVGQILPFKSPSFNELLTTIGQHIPNSDWVSSAGTASIGDGTHFNNTSQKLLGQRYAERMIPRLYESLPHVDLMSEGFNTMPSHTASAEWTITSAGGTVTVEEIPSSTNKSIRLYDDSNTAAVSAAKNFTQHTGDVVYEFRMMGEQTGGSAGFSGRSTAGTNAFTVALSPAGDIYTYDGDVQTVIQTYSANTWYNVRVVAKLSSNTFDLYIDNVLKVKGLSFRNSATGLKGVHLNTGGSARGTFFFDDIEVYYY